MKTTLKLPILALAGIALAALAAFTLSFSVSPMPAEAQSSTSEKNPSSVSASLSHFPNPSDSDTQPASSKPARPVNVAATTSDTAVTLTWDDPGDSSITGYQIQRRVVAKGEKLSVIAANTGSSDASYEDADVLPNKKYAYRVRAINSAGTSRPSSNIEVRYLIDESIPGNLTGTPKHYRVVLNWDVPSYSGVTGYKVLKKLHSDKSGEFEVIATMRARTATEHTDLNAEPNTRYVYRVKAMIPGGLSNPSKLLDVRTASLLGMDEDFTPPVHLTSMAWFTDGDHWPGGASYTGANVVEVDFTIHNDVVLDDSTADFTFYFMILAEKISETSFYLGLQIDENDHAGVGHGKRLIFSRWGTRDLNNVRLPEENSWSQSSGHEGDFVGARIAYNWGAGDYKIKLAAEDREDSEGRWFGVWITDKSTDETTWGGSLRFPFKDGQARVRATAVNSVIEVVGGVSITPRDIPAWHLSMSRPSYTFGTYTFQPTYYLNGYSHRKGSEYVSVPNSDLSYDRVNDEMHFRVGGTTERSGGEGYVFLE